MSFEGGCFCGAVRYRLTSAPMFIHCCHCRDCQRQTGSAFAINALIETSRVVIEGEAPVAILMKTESGRPHHIHRCAACQCAVWSVYGGRDQFRFVRVATLDEPTLTPDVHIYTRSKLPWVRVPEGARAFAEYYDAKVEWPADSLARRAAALEGA